MKLQKLSEAEKALLCGLNTEDIDESHIACGASGCYLLGLICEKQSRQKEALHYFLKALELNPSLWVAFEKVCKLDPNINPNSFFPDTHPNLKIAGSPSADNTEKGVIIKKIDKRSSLVTPPHKENPGEIYLKC
jgi:hypothetical protein